MRNAFFTGGKDPRKNSFESLALAGLVSRIPGFHPGYPGSIPGQGIKISLHATAHCYPTEITSTSSLTWELVGNAESQAPPCPLDSESAIYFFSSALSLLGDANS